MYIHHLALCPQITFFDLVLVFSFVSSILPPTSPAPIIAPFIHWGHWHHRFLSPPCSRNDAGPGLICSIVSHCHTCSSSLVWAAFYLCWFGWYGRAYQCLVWPSYWFFRTFVSRWTFSWDDSYSRIISQLQLKKLKIWLQKSWNSLGPRNGCITFYGQITFYD